MSIADAAMPDPVAAGELAAGTLRALRAALLPEEVAVFDTEFGQAMAEATKALDLAPVLDFLRRWRRIAAATTADPTGHRRMLALAADHAAGRPVPAAANHGRRSRPASDCDRPDCDRPDPVTRPGAAGGRP